jgi:hypothetical protein
VKQILCLGEHVKVCFEPKSAFRIVKGQEKKKKRDNEFWEGVIVETPFRNPGNLAIRVRRPINRTTPSYEALHDKKINSINSDQLPKEVTLINVPLTTIYLKAVEGIKVAKRRVAAVQRISPLVVKVKHSKSKKKIAPGQEDEGESSSKDEYDTDDTDVDTDDADIDDEDMADIKWAISGLEVSSRPITHHKSPSENFIDKNSWQRDVIRGMTLSDALDKSIPVINYFIGVNKFWCEAVLGVLTPRQRDRLPNIMTCAPLGIVPIMGIPGGGKSHLLAAMAMLCLGSVDRDKIMCCTPTHAAADALLSKLDIVSRKVVAEFNAKVQLREPHPLPLIVRAYHVQVEIETILYMARNLGEVPNHQSNPWSTMHWAMDHSFAEYILKVFSYGKYILDANDPPKLFELQRMILYEDKRYKDVSDVLGGMRVQDVMARRTSEQKDWPSVEGLIRRLMLQIALAADIIVSTSHGSLERLTKCFNKEIAKVTLLDEAGCIQDAEAIIPWRCSRPLLLAGDINQLPPAVLSNKKKTVGNKTVPANVFSNHSSISILQHITSSGWPCLVLDEQLRICRGGFDLAHMVTYKGQEVRETANIALNSQRYKYASRIDDLLQKLDSSIARSPDGKLWPVFVHCSKTKCIQTENSSRYNVEQANTALNLIRRIGSDLKASPDDMLIIVPYRAMLNHVCSRLAKEPDPLKNVRVATADSFQGHEARLTFFIMTVTANSGPGFLCERRRLNVCSTRHTEMFFAIGDINTVTSAKASVPTPGGIDEGQYVTQYTSRPQWLFEFLQWFKNTRRVITKF